MLDASCTFVVRLTVVGLPVASPVVVVVAQHAIEDDADNADDR
jgi:hypothetical protein